MKRLLSIFRRQPAPKRTFLELLREFIDKSAIENCLVEATIKKAEGYYNNISIFLHTQKMHDCKIEDFKIKTAEGLKYWLHKNLPTCSVSHASRHLELCKRALKYAVVMEYIEHSSIEVIETKRDRPKEVVYLTQKEIDKMIAASFRSDIYNIVTDLYLFQCFTGLSYGDLWSYQIINEDGFTWITSRRSKTDKTYCSEYCSFAKVINDKYNGILPRIANQTYNRIIKEVAALLNIDKHLTTHTARKTFATIKNNEGYSHEAIADMMGNTPEVARKHYINVTRERLKTEIIRLTGGFGRPSLN